MFILNGFKPQQFYAQPEDTPASGDAEETPAEGRENDGRVIEIKFKGETKKFNLDVPDDFQTVSDYASKGHAYEQGQQQLNLYRSQVDSWNQLIADSKENDESFNKLVGFIESQTGRSLSAKQKEELKDIENDLESDDPAVAKLLSRINGLETRLEADKKESEKAKIDHQANKLLKQLEGMEKDQQSYPGFNAEEILREAQSRGIYDFEMVYFYTNKDKILKAEKEKALKEAKALQDKRRGAFSESSPTPAGGGVKDVPLKAKNFSKLGDAIFEKMKKEGKSFFN